MKLYNLPALSIVILVLFFLIGCDSSAKTGAAINDNLSIIDTNTNKELTAKITVSYNTDEDSGSDISKKLSDAKYASEDSFEDSEWIRTKESKMIIDYEWETIQSIKSIALKLGNDFKSSIYLPKRITLKLSKDGTTFKNGSTINRFDQSQKVSKTVMNFGPNDVKKLRLIIEGYGVIKDGLPGEGKKAQVYLDDIIIN